MRRALGAVVCVAALLSPTAAAASVRPGANGAPATSTRTAPVIGFVYAAGEATKLGVLGITVYRQRSDGSLTDIQEVPIPAGGSPNIVLVHLTSGLTLYDLSGTGLSAFHVSRTTGHLAAFKVPAPKSPLISVYGLGAFDPRGHGMTGPPGLIASTCTTVPYCSNLAFETFTVNPKTGALNSGTVGAFTANIAMDEPIVGNGAGHFAYVERNTQFHDDVVSLRATVKSGKVVYSTVSARAVADSSGGQSPQNQSVGPGGVLITRSGELEFPAGPLYAISDHPPGWVAYAFGSRTAAPYEARIDASEVTASAEGAHHVFVGELGGNLPTGTCGIELFGTGVPGLGGVRKLLPCTQSQFLNSLYYQGGFLYVSRYFGATAGFKETAGGLTSTSQGTVPQGAQIYSWTGFKV